MSLATALELIKSVGFHVRDVGLLNSALVRPKTTVSGSDAYPDFPLKVAALMQSVTKNLPLIDGNKRTSWILMSVFLQLNGCQHTMDVDTGFDLVLGLKTDRYTIEEAARIIAEHLVPLK